MLKLSLLASILWSSASTADIVSFEESYSRRGSQSQKVVVDLSSQGQTLTRDFYGSQIESRAALPNATLIKELQLGKLRMGGNEYDVFNWETGISIAQNGEFQKLQKIEDLAKAFQSLNAKGIFQINLTGYQPEWNGNGYNVVRSFDAQAAAEMIKHLNGKLKLGLVDFSLGNEFEQWHYTHSNIWDNEDGITADEYIERYIEFAVAIRKAQEEVNGNPNSIKIWGPEFSGSWMDWNTGNFSEDCAWTDVPAQVACSYGNGQFTHFIPYFLHRLKAAEADKSVNPAGYKLIDKFAFHYYPNFRKKSSDENSIHTDENGRQYVAQMLASTQVLNNANFVNKLDLSSYKGFSPNIIPRMKAWIAQNYPGLDLVMNEFAFDSDYRTFNYHPIVRPLYLADTIGIMASEGVTFFNNFILSSPPSGDLPWSLIRQGRFKTHLFHQYKLFTNHFLGQLKMTKDNMGDTLNAYATVEGDELTVVVVNKEPFAQSFDLMTSTQGRESKLTSYSAPAWSTSVLKLKKDPGFFTRKYQVLRYGAKEMGIPVESVYSSKQ